VSKHFSKAAISFLSQNNTMFDIGEDVQISLSTPGTWIPGSEDPMQALTSLISYIALPLHWSFQTEWMSIAGHFCNFWKSSQAEIRKLGFISHFTPSPISPWVQTPPLSGEESNPWHDLFQRNLHPNSLNQLLSFKAELQDFCTIIFYFSNV
jgi:hypothetical protein